MSFDNKIYLKNLIKNLCLKTPLKNIFLCYYYYNKIYDKWLTFGYCKIKINYVKITD